MVFLKSHYLGGKVAKLNKYNIHPFVISLQLRIILAREEIPTSTMDNQGTAGHVGGGTTFLFTHSTPRIVLEASGGET